MEEMMAIMREKLLQEATTLPDDDDGRAEAISLLEGEWDIDPDNNEKDMAAVKYLYAPFYFDTKGLIANKATVGMLFDACPYIFGLKKKEDHLKIVQEGE
jgi:hypothetical protein